jgi:hypothetical protein
VFLDSVGKSMALKGSKYKPPGLRPPTADAGFLTALTLVTALTGLTADIVDEIDLIGWVTSLAICSSALAANNVILVNPVRCQHRQPCQHRQYRPIAAAAGGVYQVTKRVSPLQ